MRWQPHTKRGPALLAVLAFIGLAGCQSVAETPMPKRPVVEAGAGLAAHDNLNATAWVQQATEAHLSHRQTWRAAERLLDQALADPSWDALAPMDRIVPTATLPVAIIVDVDETVLDNSAYQARLIRDGARFADPTWNAWVDERAAPAVSGAAAFAQAATQRGITMIYLTNREHAKSAATRENLQAVGFPAVAAEQFLGLGVDTPGCQSVGSDKSCRRQWVAQRYRVLMQFGDQISDFVSIPDNSLAGRAAQLQAFDPWIGERWFTLANPSYGSWHSALYGNQRGLSPEAERAAKRAALRY